MRPVRETAAVDRPSLPRDARSTAPTHTGGGLALSSFFLGGFECAAQRRADGRRLDLLASTGHDRLCDADFRLLRRHGVSAARDGMRWHVIEAEPGRYDWSSVLPMLEAARRHDIRIAWDLCHYGWPDGLDIWSEDFVRRFARFAVAAARIVSDETNGSPIFCTVNEISYWAWAGGETGRIAPATRGRGADLKRRLVRASIAATRAIRDAVPRARFLHAEPAIHVVPAVADPESVAAAESHRLSQFEALDMMCGRQAPDLGGAPDLLDIVGVNYYPDNQWYAGGATIPLGHHAYHPLRSLLGEIHTRYGRPIILAETGAEGSAKAAWLHYVCAEVRAAQCAGVPVEGICLYPILDYPGWDDDRPCAVGLFSRADRHGVRETDRDFADELARQRDLFAAQARRAVPGDARAAS